MSDDVRREEDEPVTEIAQANEAAERLEAYYLGGQPGIYYTEQDARAAFIEDILKVVKGYKILREHLEQAKIRVKQLEAAYDELRTIVWWSC